VRNAVDQGFVSRAAFKLTEIDDRFKILRTDQTVIDLGAAPGGWTQVALQRVGAKGRVVSCDLQPLSPSVTGSQCILGDVREDAVVHRIATATGVNLAHVVLSDMAPNTSGIVDLDATRAAECVLLGATLCARVLRRGGTFLAKLRRGSPDDEKMILDRLSQQGFASLKWVKPAASRKESHEIFILAQDYRR
jgi:23S rRNA (uridine2552-2'-O)-methyltransferase